MKSVDKNSKKSKKSRRLGEPRVMGIEGYSGLEVNAKVEMIRALIPLGLMHVQEVLEREVEELAGERYHRGDARPELVRQGSNPGSVKWAGQRHAMRIPRVRNRERKEEVRLESRDRMRESGEGRKG